MTDEDESQACEMPIGGPRALQAKKVQRGTFNSAQFDCGEASALDSPAQFLLNYCGIAVLPDGPIPVS